MFHWSWIFQTNMKRDWQCFYLREVCWVKVKSVIKGTKLCKFVPPTKYIFSFPLSRHKRHWVLFRGVQLLQNMLWVHLSTQTNSGRLVLVQNLFRWQRRDSLPFVGPRKSWPSDTWWCVLLSAVPDIKRSLQLLVDTLTFWWRRWLTLLCSLRRWAPSRSWLLFGMLETLQAGSFSTGLCCMFCVLTEGWISIISVLMWSVMLSAEWSDSLQHRRLPAWIYY